MYGNLNETDDEFMNGDFRECDCDERSFLIKGGVFCAVILISLMAMRGRIVV